MHSRIGWSQPPANWGPPQMPGWAPLVDPGHHHPLQTARAVGRWLWPTVAVTGFLAVTGFVLGHDDPTPGLSHRGLLTIALAALVVILLTIHRRFGVWSLARALVEYAVVFLLAALVATTGLDVDQLSTGAEHASSAARDQRPALIKAIDGFGDWLSEWRTWAHNETNRRAHSASATSPAPPPPSSTRRPL